MPSLALAIITIALYLLATVVQSWGLTGKFRYSKISLLLLGFAAIILHAFLLYRWIDIPTGQNLAFFNMLSFVMWLIALLILLTALRKPIETLTLFIFPLAAISIVLIILFPQSYIIKTSQDPQQLWHILLSALAFSVLCIAGLQAVLLAIQEQQLRNKYVSVWIQKLPAIETMEALLFQIIALGFLLLTLLIITSIGFFHQRVTLGLIQKIILATIAWIIFGILLLGRYWFGWRGRKAIYGTLVGVLILIITYFGSILLMEYYFE